MVAVDRGRAVINEGSDTAGDIPVAISGALVCVVEEAVVGVFFVQRWLRDGIERVIYGALELGHLGNVARLICVELVSADRIVTREAQNMAVATRGRNLWLEGSLKSELEL